MNSVNREIQNILELQSKAQVNVQNVFARREQLRERIKKGEKGETTGDRIKDFVIVRYGFTSEQIEAIYRDLETRISQHIGEFVLMIVKEENLRDCCTGLRYVPKDSNYVLDEYYYLGVLKSKDLVLILANEQCELPTDDYVRFRDVWRRDDIELIRGNISLGWRYDFGINLNKPLQLRNSMACLQTEPDLELEIKIGDIEVEAWVQKRHYYSIFQKAARLLGRPLTESPESVAELQQQHEAVIKQLTKLIKERNQFKQQIARIFGAVSGMYSPDGVSVTVCETKDDAFFISMGLRQKLKEIEGEIEIQNKIALDLGLVQVLE